MATPSVEAVLHPVPALYLPTLLRVLWATDSACPSQALVDGLAASDPPFYVSLVDAANVQQDR